MSDQTLEVAPLQVPSAAPPTGSESSPRGKTTLSGAYPWILAAAGLLVISLVVVLLAGARPGYDPYGWLVWGKLTIHLKLDTNGAPSWKPLPFLFTVPYALLGHYSLWLWMVTSVAISLSGPVFAWRVAFRLTGADPERRYASYAAGLAAALFMLAMVDTVALPHLTYLHYILSAESDTMIVALCLAAIDLHLSGRHRWAFWIWWLAALGRPEVWPFLGLAGLWLWRERPAYRRWLYGALVLLAFMWFGIPGLTSKSALTASNIAENSPREVHGNKIIGVLDRYHSLQPDGVWVTATLGVLLAAWRRWWTILILAGGALLWLLIEIAFSLHGYPSVPRYMFESGAVVSVLAGVFIGRLILELPGVLAGCVRKLRTLRLSARIATKAGTWGTVIVLVAIAGSVLPVAHTQLRLERLDLKHERGRADLIDRLKGVVDKLGAQHILACGQPNIPIGYQSVLAWYMGVKIGILYVSLTYERLHPHPLVNIYPISGAGWKVFPSHVSSASATRCSGLTLVYR